MSFTKRTKDIIIDVLGGMFILTSILVGWLPGPLGIPLFLIGLGLLATNHTWAERRLDWARENIADFSRKIFVERPLWQAAYDAVAAVSIGSGIYLLVTHTSNLTLSISIFGLCLGLALFLGNRQRLDRLKRFFKHKH